MPCCTSTWRKISQGVGLTRIEEGQRTPLSRSANRYLKRIRYGNRFPRQDGEDLSLRSDWMFEVVLDYGDHPADNPLPLPSQPWPARQDAFSTYRAGFEVRTYRLCRRVLMFHHFPAEALGDDCLVRSLDLVYNEDPVVSFITSAAQSGYTRTAPTVYLKELLPPVEFGYTQAVIDETVHEMDAASLENLPAGLYQGYRLADLDGEGLSGILAEQGQAWFYKPNLGGTFGPAQRVDPTPSFANLEGGRQQLVDLAGDGSLDLAQFSGPVPGFFERISKGGWAPYQTFDSLPVIDWNDPGLRFIDLTGDGHADLLLASDQAFTWYPSLAEQGFGPAGWVHTPLDERDGPALVFADGTQTIFLADMSGDGLVDLVRVRSGEVCYWPNLGYGRFGRQVSMGAAPHFDPPDQFDPRRLRLADIDGSGTTDLIYLETSGVRLYFNQCGNRFSPAQVLGVFPPVDTLANISVADLLGSGTACLVWSSPLPGETGRSLRYIDLMGGVKPHLLVTQRNNLGAETVAHYVPSTQFYLADKLAGKPWITRLPFPVQVVDRVEIHDRVSKNRFVTRYAYHHGYFDGPEREFRGFGLVEQWDTEEFAVLNASPDFPDAVNVDAASHVPPVYTRSWYHTGAYVQGGRISRLFEDDYYQEADPSQGPAVLSAAQLEAMRLADTVLPDNAFLPDNTRLPLNLSPQESREACRALKGSLLRQEIYGLDGSQAADRPYLVSERSYTLELLQPLAGEQHAVFFNHKREALDFHYERALYNVAGQTLADPRVQHSMELVVDYFGNSLQSVTVGYGRRHPDPDPLLSPADRAQQTRLRVTLTENTVTNPVDLDDAWRLPQLCETRTFELLKVSPAAALAMVTNLFGFAEMQGLAAAAGDGVHDLPYEDGAASGATQSAPYRRLVEHMRVLYRRDDLTGALAAGQLQSRGLPYERYRLALTPGLLGEVYGARVTDPMLAECGYVHFQGDGQWWMPDGQMFYSPNEADSPAQELAYAGQHFFMPCRYRDPFGSTTHVRYDDYDLLLLETEDPLHNRVTAGERSAGGAVTPALDYRVLQPALLTDPNRNRTAAAFCALGLVTGTAVMGKTGQTVGDSLPGFNPDLPPAVIQAHLANPFTAPEAILQQASTRLVYDLFAYQNTQADPQPLPVVTYTLARETHAADLAGGAVPPIQHSFTYSDGFGREIQKKMQAEPGPLVEGGADADPRWVGSGWVVYNNKGKPVRKYEPFFSSSQQFEFGMAVGVSPVIFYDPMSRIAATLRPDHSYEKTVFDPWRQTAWDPNDTVLQADPRGDPDVGDFFQRLLTAQFLPTWHAARSGGGLGAAQQAAAVKAAQHANTPDRVFFDTLGRPCLTVKDAGGGQTFSTRTEIDIEGQVQHVIDPRGRTALDYTAHPAGLQAPGYDIAGHLIYQAHIDAGERRILFDIHGKSAYHWDARGGRLHTTYDALRRPLELRALPQGAVTERVLERSVYGEAQGDALNHRGRTFQQFDDAGLQTSTAVDFKGNLLGSSRQLVSDYHTAPDWSGGVVLEPGVYSRATQYDALNRARQLDEPDGSQVALVYNQANLLEAVQARAGAVGPLTDILSNLDYNARGQQILIDYGNGVRSSYIYDAQTFRLSELHTLRGADPLQDLSYTYDPVGNLASISDAAQQTIFFNNAVVAPGADYTYDGAYRLVAAGGREHIGLAGQPQTSWNDAGRTGLAHPHDGAAMRTYSEQYTYDETGNLISLVHQALGGNWTRLYRYDEPNPLPANNRLTSVMVGAEVDQYHYDEDGNLLQINLAGMEWDPRDRLATADAGSGKAIYRYDSSGQRVRKVVDRQNGTRQRERIYLGGYELYREFDGSGATITLARSTLHVMYGEHRAALIETRISGSDGLPAQVTRYQLADHLGSASLELDGAGAIISYEEYYPFGSTSYQAGPNATETNLKRYRFTGMERDSETGFNYHSARYYLPWLGRWASVDPLVLGGGEPGKAAGMASSPYVYASNRPTGLIDRSGLDDTPPTLGPVQITGFRYRLGQPWTGRYTLPSLLSDDRSTSGTLRVHHLSAEGTLTVPELGRGGPLLLADVDFAARTSADGGGRIGGVGLLRTGEIGSGLWASLYVRGVVDTPLSLDPSRPETIARALPEGSGRFTLLGNVSAGNFTLGTFTGSATLGDHQVRFNSELSAMGLARLELRGTGTYESAGALGLDASARLSVFGIPTISAHGTGALETSGAYQFSGTFSGYIPPVSYTTGTFGLRSGESPSFSAHVFGATYLPSIDVKDPSPIPAAARQFLHLPADPSVPSGLILGYSYTSLSHGAFTHIGAGVTVSSHPAAAAYLQVPF